MKENYGKEALELAQEVSYKFRQEQTLDRTTLSFFKYVLNLKQFQILTLPSFIGQQGACVHIDVKYSTTAEFGTVAVIFNNQRVRVYALSDNISLDLIMSRTNTIKFDIDAPANTTLKNIVITISGEIKKPIMSRDLLIVDSFGCNIYQPMLDGKFYTYTFDSQGSMMNVLDATPTDTTSYFDDYCYKYDSTGEKTGRVTTGSSSTLSIYDASTSISGTVTDVTCSCVAPLFDDEDGDYIVYYVKDGKTYYAKVGESFSDSVEISIPTVYGIKKMTSLKKLSSGTHLPHFCFVDNKNDAYFVICNSVGSYSNPQKLGKAERVLAYQNNSQITILLSYQDTVVKFVGSISSSSGSGVLTVTSKSKINNADSACMNMSGGILYKSRNAIDATITG